MIVNWWIWNGADVSFDNDKCAGDMFFFYRFCIISRALPVSELILCSSSAFCVCVRREWQISSKFNHIFFIHATMIMSFWNENCIYTESQCDDAHWSHTLYVAFNFPAVPLAAADPVSLAKYRRKTQISVWWKKESQFNECQKCEMRSFLHTILPTVCGWTGS